MPDERWTGALPVIDLEKHRARIARLDTVRVNGLVSQVIGLVVESIGPATHVGDICQIKHHGERNAPSVRAEVVGFRGDRVLLMPLGDMAGIKLGSEVIATGRTPTVAVGAHLLGRVLDGLGEPIDGKGPLDLGRARRYPLNAAPPDPLTRRRITEPLQIGIRAIDGVLTLGKGQRIGIFSGSGVGKSTILGMIARNTAADVNVICLVGERGREVREFIESDLGEEGLKRSVLVVATSDRPPLVRLKAPFVATAIAEYFRDAGKDVMLMTDSVTRFAMAQREVGLAVGEMPVLRGYPPSVFALLPRILERAGASEKGTITGLYTVLVEGDDENEPICDAVRGILDGHIWLSRDLAARNHYPAIEIARSVSRVLPQITTETHRAVVGKLRSALAAYAQAEDLITIGAYAAGSDPAVDRARRLIEPIRAFLRQGVTERSTLEQTLAALERIFDVEEL
jgi:flagellum-specific ATP synthase